MLVTSAVVGLAIVCGAYFYISPELPDIHQLSEVQLQVPLRVYTSEGLLMAEFGEQRRQPLEYEQIPESMIQAILATEDDRFFEHPGVDYQGIVRAVVELVRTGKKSQGGSTITMQVARNFFLSREKTYLRKLTEIFLALKIERLLSKEDILELYLNKIYFGHRAYGVAAAAQVYYGLGVDEISLAQIATIAGLPKAPSTNNPVSNPQRALERRNYVLSRMHRLGFIDTAQYRAAVDEPDHASLHSPSVDVEASHVAEMVRAYMMDKYGKATYSSGFRVTTTINAARQRAANKALRKHLVAYDRRRGYRGASGHIEIGDEVDPAALDARLRNIQSVGGLPTGIVTEVRDQAAMVYLESHGYVVIGWEGLSWARRFETVNRKGPKLTTASEVLKRGDLVRVEQMDDAQWQLAQLPLVSAALVSVLPETGALQSLVGGFDFKQSNFNRAVQARRQPGSSFKPFIYSAALHKGYTAASLFNDAPVVFDDPSLETTWRPENYSGKFYGPTRMREALTRSRNLVSIRLLRAIGSRYAARYSQRFGFEPEHIPRDLSLALGSGSATPWEMANAYAVFANGGFEIEPYFIDEITGPGGEIIYKADPLIACAECESIDEKKETLEEELLVEFIGPPAPQPNYAERVIDEANVYLMNSMLRDVVKRGTGRRAMKLGRNDLAGKTGTTNDQRDAWFCGFNADLVTTVWLGYDRVQPLGNGETGGRAALPVWIDYMREALRNVKETSLIPPENLTTVRIDPDTGLRLAPGQSGGLFEYFRPENLPARSIGTKQFPTQVQGYQEAVDEEPLF